MVWSKAACEEAERDREQVDRIALAHASVDDAARWYARRVSRRTALGSATLAGVVSISAGLSARWNDAFVDELERRNQE